jgi:hypothetical protein
MQVEWKVGLLAPQKDSEMDDVFFLSPSPSFSWDSSRLLEKLASNLSWRK